MVDYCIAEYAAGRTSIPCIPCNRIIKFGFLLGRASMLGAAAVASGHYARVRHSEGEYQLLRGVDRQKD